MENQRYVLTDGTVVLRPFTVDDVDVHLAGEDDEQVKWLNEGKASAPESVRAWIARNQEQRRANGPVINFAITDEQGKLVGMVEANTEVEKMTGLQVGDANISYNVYPDARGKGYATRAVALIEKYLASRGVKRAVLRINPGNEASLGVPNRLGYDELDPIRTPEGSTLRMFVKDLANY